MAIGMFQSRILTPHRPRRYGLLQVADVTRHGLDEDNRWIGGANNVEMGTTLHNVELTACDFSVTGRDVTEGATSQSLAWSSVLTGECSTLSGEDTLRQMGENLRAEHQALLPYILDEELLRGTISGNDGLADMAVRTNPGSALSPAAIVGYAESLEASYETLILIPIALFSQAAETGVWADGDRWVSRTGNTIAPHQAGDDVYVLPAPVKLDLRVGGGPEESRVERSTNTVEKASTIIGLFQVHGEVHVFDPTP